MYHCAMSVGFNDAAPAVNPPLGGVSPPIAAEASAEQRFTLDRSSFEKLLAAAWVLQCLQDRFDVDRDESIVTPGWTKKDIETANPALPAEMIPVRQFLPSVEDADSKHEAVNAQLVGDTNSAEPVSDAAVSFDPAAKFDLKTAELKIPQSDAMATPQPIDAPTPVLTDPGNGNRKEWAQPRAILEVRPFFSRAQVAFIHLLPGFRVNLTMRGLRAVAIATPVWLLSLVAALLFLQAWRHESLHSAQASRPSPPTVEAPLTNIPPTVTPPTLTTARPASMEVKRTDVNRTENERRSGALAALESSHERITDPATWSAVQQLSRYEIKSLRRQAMYGDDSAAFTLGMAYEVGNSVPQNCVEAARWVTLAAEAGDAAAQYNLGLRYHVGDGVGANQAESEKWLRKAARKSRQAKLALKIFAAP